MRRPSWTCRSHPRQLAILHVLGTAVRPQDHVNVQCAKAMLTSLNIPIPRKTQKGIQAIFTLR